MFFFCHFYFIFICFGDFMGCICTNVIYTSNAPKLFCGCRQPNTLWCVCVRGNSPICLCVMYINVALYGIYIKSEECRYMNKIRPWFLQSFLVVLMSFVTLCACEQRQKFWLRSFWGNQAVWSVRPASVSASPLCMTRPQGWYDHSSALYC